MAPYRVDDGEERPLLSDDPFFSYSCSSSRPSSSYSHIVETSIPSSSQTSLASDPDSKPKAAGGVHDVTLTPFRFWGVIMILIGTQFFVSFDTYIVSTSHTVITSTFRTSHLASWLATSFMITFSTSQPVYAAFTESHGRYVPFVLSFGFFTFGTLGCALAQSMLQLVLARAVCGFGAGGVRCLVPIVLSDILPLHRRGFFQSINAVSYTLGQASGVAIGGLMAERLGWRWSFGVQMPLCIFLLVTSAWLLPRPPANLPPRTHGFDFRGTTLLFGMLLTLTSTLSFGGTVIPWSDPKLIATGLAAAVFAAAFLYSQLTSANPLLPPSFFTNRPLPNLLVAGFFMTATYAIVLFNLPLYLQAVLLESPTRAGLAFLPACVFSMMGSVVAGLVISHAFVRGCFQSLYGGALVLCIGTTFYALNHYLVGWAFAVGMAFSGTLMTLVGVSGNQHARTTGTSTFLRGLGSLLGITLSSVIVQSGVRRELAYDPKLAEKVAREVRVIPGLEESVRRKAVMAYAKALRGTDWLAVGCTVMALVALCMGGKGKLWGFIVAEEMDREEEQGKDTIKKVADLEARGTKV